MPAVIFISLFTLIFLAIVAVFLFVNQKRTREMNSLARDFEFQFYPKGSEKLPPLLTQLDFFSLGKYKRITNLMMGQLPPSNGAVSVAIFDYSFTVGLKEDTKTFCQTVVLFFVQDMDLPHFRLSPDNALNKIGNFIGFRNIKFSQYPTFPQRYCLLSDQEEWIRRIFQSRMIEFLEEENFSAEAPGNYLAIYPDRDSVPQGLKGSIYSGRNDAESRFLQPEEIPLFLETGTTFLKLLRGN